jgi:HEAT repeat protein
MPLAGAARLFLDNALWRLSSWRTAGRRLVEALGSEDENVRTIAGMFLVKAGRKAKPLLEEALAKRQSLPLVLTILGDIGDHQSVATLRPFTEDPDPQVAKAAQDALKVLLHQSSSSPYCEGRLP